MDFLRSSAGPSSQQVKKNDVKTLSEKREKMPYNTTDEHTSTQIIFVQDKFYLGGIEILELKLVDELTRHGLDTVLASRANDTFDAPNAVRARFVHQGYPDFLSRTLELLSESTKKVIFVSLHPTAAIASEIAGRQIRSRNGDRISVHHFHWVSHSRAFFFSTRKLVRGLLQRFFLLLPVNSTYFMNDAARIAHQTFWQRSLVDYPVLRIVGREPSAKYVKSSKVTNHSNKSACHKLRIVSVGRLVPFKSYNVYAPIIIRKLRDAGVDATWDIWGYGPDEAVIASKAKEYEVNDFVKLRGKLPHELFDKTVSSYDLFVGMGTAVLEAAKTGTPVCVAVENQRDACYGHLHEAPIDSLGDRVVGFHEQKLYEALSAFAAKSSQEQSTIGEKGAVAARRRESKLSEFVAAILSAQPIGEARFFDRVLLLVGKAYLTLNYWKHK